MMCCALQFLGTCIDMVHEEFPWTHVVHGRPRYPNSQGSMERSHDPYKKSLLSKLKEKDLDDWVRFMYIVQCEVNNRPSRSRGDISPYTMYYSKTNKPCYSSVLGKSYKHASTEYGLRLAQLMLQKIKSLDPAWVLTSDEVEWVICLGDDLFLETALDVMDSRVSLRAAAIDALKHYWKIWRVKTT